MADKMLYIPNDDKQNAPFCRLQLIVQTFGHSINKPANQNSIKIPKLLGQRIRKHYKTLGTSVINSPMSPASLDNTLCKIIVNKSL